MTITKNNLDGVPTAAEYHRPQRGQQHVLRPPEPPRNGPILEGDRHMKLKKIAAVLSMGVVMLASRAALAADAKPAEKPAEKAAEKSADAKPEAKPSAAGVKLTKPWSEIASLTDEQKLKI